MSYLWAPRCSSDALVRSGRSRPREPRGFDPAGGLFFKLWPTLPLPALDGCLILLPGLDRLLVDPTATASECTGRWVDGTGCRTGVRSGPPPAGWSTGWWSIPAARPGLEPLVGGAQAEAATRPAFIESSPHYFCHAEIASKPKWNCSLNAANEFNFSYQRGKFIFRRSWSPDVLNLINKQRTPGNRTLPPFKAIKRRSCGVGGEEVRRGIGSA